MLRHANLVNVVVRHGLVDGVEHPISPIDAKDLLAAVATSRHFAPGGSLEDVTAIVSTNHAPTEGMALMWYPQPTAGKAPES